MQKEKKLTIRMPLEVHRLLTEYAKENDLSQNRAVLRLIRKNTARKENEREREP